MFGRKEKNSITGLTGSSDCLAVIHFGELGSVRCSHFVITWLSLPMSLDRLQVQLYSSGHSFKLTGQYFTVSVYGMKFQWHTDKLVAVGIFRQLGHTV